MTHIRVLGAEQAHIVAGAPPSYEQAIGSTAPPLQVLLIPETINGRQQQPTATSPPQPNAAAASANTPQGAFQGGRNDGGATHVMQQPVVIIHQQALLPLGPDPVYITCPACHKQKLTRIEYMPSLRTHLMAALLCILGFWCCACLPYCAESCMNTNHYCGSCNKFLGTYGDSL